jgi:acyl-CoA reductase-like NAD-dependent aldehyde dehydrogenase
VSANPHGASLSSPAMDTRLLIGGERVAGDGASLEVENPATEEVVASVGAPSPEQLDAAIAAGG